jgi:hypothetical protein
MWSGPKVVSLKPWDVGIHGIRDKERSHDSPKPHALLGIIWTRCWLWMLAVKRSMARDIHHGVFQWEGRLKPQGHLLTYVVDMDSCHRSWQGDSRCSGEGSRQTGKAWTLTLLLQKQVFVLNVAKPGSMAPIHFQLQTPLNNICCDSACSHSIYTHQVTSVPCWHTSWEVPNFSISHFTGVVPKSEWNWRTWMITEDTKV